MQLTITDIAFGGKGVGRSEGLVVFVPYTIIGETVTVELTQKKKNHAQARLISVDVPASERVEPRCPAFGRCGGCSYQHIAYSAQCALKGAQVEQTLRRLGKIENVPMRPVVASPECYEYRNRIRVHAQGGVVGFHAADEYSLLDIPHCAIAAPGVNEQLAQLRTRVLPDGDYTLGRTEGSPYFEQTNTAVGALLLETVGNCLPGGECLVDAYCGAGFFARYLRERYQRIVGIEENAFAIAQAKRGAQAHEHYIAGDVALALPLQLTERAHLVLDPPSAGISARVSDAILGALPQEIVYVSCNPATLARDLVALAPAYRLESVTPLDMFAQTAQIEVVVHLRRK